MHHPHCTHKKKASGLGPSHRAIIVAAHGLALSAASIVQFTRKGKASAAQAADVVRPLGSVAVQPPQPRVNKGWAHGPQGDVQPADTAGGVESVLCAKESRPKQSPEAAGIVPAEGDDDVDEHVPRK